MRKRFAGAVLLAALAGIVCGGLAAGSPAVVSKIQIDGLVEIRTSDVLDVVQIAVGDEVSENDLKAASQAIFDLGWFNEVFPEVSEDGVVVFHVVEYPVIQEIVISGNVNKRPYDLFGIRLFELPLVSTTRIRALLRENDIRKRKVLNRLSLEQGLQDIISDYNDRGYILIMLGNVGLGETLSIELVEGLIVDNRIEALPTVPLSVAEEMIDLPLGLPLQQKDLEKVLAQLRASVYFSDVEVVPQNVQAPEAVTLVWRLTERTLIDSPTVIERVELSGISRFPIERARSSLGSIPEDPVTNYELLRILEGLYYLYQQAGYIMARFVVEGAEDGVLRVRVDEGRISEVLISGNTKTKDYVLSRNLDISAGQVLTRNLLRAAYQQLGALGYFDSVNMLPEWSDDGVRLSVVIAEKDRLGGMNGALALEPGTGGIVGELSVNQKNLMGTGQDLTLSYSRGLVSTVDPISSTWNLGYDTVAYFSEFDRVGFDIYRKITDIGSEEDLESYVTFGFKTSFDYPVSDYTSLQLSYKHEDERLTDETLWTPIDAVTLALAYDDVADPYFPTEGSRRVLGIEQAGGFAAGDEYTKLAMTWTRFSLLDTPLFRAYRRVLAIRLRADWGDDGLPATQRYELGGPMTIRGMTGESVDRRFVANFEHRFEVTEGLVFTTFLDAGVNLGSVRAADALAAAGFELGLNVGGIVVRLDFVWALGEDWTWAPRFDLGFGPMF